LERAEVAVYLLFDEKGCLCRSSIRALFVGTPIPFSLTCSDDKQIAVEFFRENSATFPTILNSSEAANRVWFDDYKCMWVPLNYIIDKVGKVVDAWYGYEQGHKRALVALEKAGLKLEGH
jgi:hypothetical protein